MPKGDFLAEFELYLMLALGRLRDEAYGVTLRREIEERTGRPVSIGAVYATLKRLEEKGFVRHWISDPLPIQGGRARKYFQLTREGERVLKHSAAMMTRMLRGVRFKAKDGVIVFPKEAAGRKVSAQGTFEEIATSAVRESHGEHAKSAESSGQPAPASPTEKIYWVRVTGAVLY